MGQAAVAVAIQHHPKRADLLAPLVVSLAGLPTAVVSDPEPEAQPSPWRTYRRALEEWLDGDYDWSHLCILQDDVLVMPRFADELNLCVSEHPDRLLSLFTGRWPERTAISVLQAQDRGERWASVMPATWVSVVALVWPRRLAEALFRFVGSARWWTPMLADDEIIGRFCRASRIYVAHRIPNPVEHPDDVPSLVKDQRRNRRSVVPWTDTIER